MPEIEFTQLSQQDLNPLGAKALALHPEQWKHGETEHFIYHFTRSFVATPVSVEAEFHYRVVAKVLERDQPPSNTKSHIYIFDKSEDWQAFQTMGQLEKWTGGIHSRGSLFIERDPKYKFAGNTLGHEISHLVMNRFYSEGIPRGSTKDSRSMFQKGRAPVINARAVTSRSRARSRSPRRN